LISYSNFHEVLIMWHAVTKRLELIFKSISSHQTDVEVRMHGESAFSTAKIVVFTFLNNLHMDLWLSEFMPAEDLFPRNAKLLIYLKGGPIWYIFTDTDDQHLAYSHSADNFLS